MPLDAQGAGQGALDAIAAEMAKSKTHFFTCHCTGRGQFERLKQTLGDRIRYASCGMQFECLG